MLNMDLCGMSEDKDSRLMILETLMAKKTMVENTLNEMRRNHEDNKDALFGDNSAEDGDRAGKEISVQTYYSLMDRRTQELEKLEKLVMHIHENEDFGFCEDCGEEIGYKRLVAMPGVTRCIDCQREIEKKWSGQKDSGQRFYAPGHSCDVDTEYDFDDFEMPSVKRKMGFLSWDDIQGIEIEDLSPSGQNNPQSSPTAANP